MADEHLMRKPCLACGNEYGEIVTRNGQDCVFCLSCRKFQYNAPKTETGREPRTVTTARSVLKPKLRAKLLMQANGRCEFCGQRENLHIGHIISVKAGVALGLSDEQINDAENLAVMCDECNLGVGDEPLPLKLAVGILLSRIDYREKHAQENPGGTEET